MTADDLVNESYRVRKVRQLVDIATSIITQARITREDAEILVEGVRRRILALFPDGAETYEVVYRRRFSRLINEFALDAFREDAGSASGFGGSSEATGHTH